MNKCVLPDLTATVRFLSTAEGGRSGATPSNFLGCLFGYGGEIYDCRLLLEGIGSIRPGDRLIVPIKFLSPDLLLGELRVGDQFDLWEGRKKIAEGVIEQL